ncbi:MAG: transcription-repair coupling factor [Firmicutes bacterium]|nr:transcription-repair coupling factor [Bacillota bacterium]
MNTHHRLTELLDAIRDKKNISAICSGVGERTFLFHKCLDYVKKNSSTHCFPAIYVCSDLPSAQRAFHQLKSFHPKTFFLPPKNDVLTYIEHKSLDIEFDRLETMSNALKNSNSLIVTTVSALTEFFPKRAVFLNSSFVLSTVNESEKLKTKSGDANNLTISPLFNFHPPLFFPKSLEEITALLHQIGYKRVEQVSSHGTFSVRGDIIDIFIIGEQNGTRIEFFGDDIETMKFFDPETHTTIETISSITVIPATDFLVCQSDDPNHLTTSSLSKKFALPHSERTQSILSSIDFLLEHNPSSPALSWLLPLVPHNNFFEFFSPSLVVYDDAKQCHDSLSSHLSEHQNRFKTLFEKGEVYHELEVSSTLLNKNTTPFNQLKNIQKIAFHSTLTQNRFFEPEALLNFRTSHVPLYNHNFAELKKDLENFKDYSVTICCGNEVLKDKLTALFSTLNPQTSMPNSSESKRIGQIAKETIRSPLLDFGQNSEQSVNTPADDTSKNKKNSNNHCALRLEGCGLKIISDSIPESVHLPDEKIILISTTALTGKKGEKQKRKTQKEYFEPEVGSHVVHDIHGVGFFEKVVRLEYDGASRDYFLILYKNNDKLYVPIENATSLSKFIGGGDIVDKESIPLNKIGGQDFENQKEKVRKKVKELAFNLAHLYAKREQSVAHKYSENDSFFDDFCLKFPYVETPCQLQASEECLGDLTSGKVMDRLLCGDVGYGKTEVAFRVAFKVATEGKQVALVCPTTILARQHFHSAVTRLGEFGVRIALLSRMNSTKETTAILEKLENGDIDMVVGTHRVLSPDVKFKDLGLLVLDEEQRFGVESKEKLKTLKANINVLSMSATPIPRTLHMSLSGIRDLSTLETPPRERKSVQTYVTGYNDSLIIDAVTREVNRNGQVFVVYNNVCKMDAFESKIQKLFPNLGITRVHGKMQPKEQEYALRTFVDGKTQILLTTTIIENGIDMPRVNTIIVINSQNFGLSQLYQLKGRVGRTPLQGYAYFTFDEEQLMTETATKRLEALTQHTDLGSGYHIAMQDLAIRGAGNILGAEQSGHMAKVGYEMYTRLLSQAVREMTGEVDNDFVMKKEVKVFTDFNAFVPDDYITDEEWKRKTYMRISRISTVDERKRLLLDLEDIYGKVPEPLSNLISVALIKNLSQKLNVISVYLNKFKTTLVFEKVSDIPSGFNPKDVRLDPTKGEMKFVDRKALMRFLLGVN